MPHLDGLAELCNAGLLAGVNDLSRCGSGP